MFAIALGIVQDGYWMVPLLIGNGGAALWFWYKYKWPDVWSNYLSFGAVVLIACFLNRLLYLADFWLVGERFSEWPFYSVAPEWAIFKGELITIAGALITVATWLRFGGAKYSPRMIISMASRAYPIRLMVSLYVVSLVIFLLQQLDPQIYRLFGQLVPTLLGLCGTAAFFIPFLMIKSRALKIIATAILSLPMVWLSITGGMKEGIIVALVPLAYISWLSFRNTGIRVSMVVLALGAFGLITSFVGYYREEAWIGKRSLTQREAIYEFYSEIGHQGFSETINDGLKGFVARNNASFYRGWAIALADEYQYEPAMIFGPMAYVFIPRMIWPEKPEIEVAREYTRLIFGFDSLSSTSVGLYTGFYLGYGWPAVLIGAVGIGLVMVGLLRFAWRIGGGLLVGLFSFSMLPFSLRLDEIWPYGAMSGPIIGFIYLAAIFLAVRVISTFFGR